MALDNDQFCAVGTALLVLAFPFLPSAAGRGGLGRQNAAAWLIAAQFAGYAATYLAMSLRLGGAWKLFQWLPFAATATAILVSGGAMAGH